MLLGISSVPRAFENNDLCENGKWRKDFRLYILNRTCNRSMRDWSSQSHTRNVSSSIWRKPEQIQTWMGLKTIAVQQHHTALPPGSWSVQGWQRRRGTFFLRRCFLLTSPPGLPLTSLFHDPYQNLVPPPPPPPPLHSTVPAVAHCTTSRKTLKHIF